MPKISLKAARVNKNLTLPAAASKIGVSESALKSWEMGKTFPTQPQIEKICAVYEIPYDYINFRP